MLKKAFFLIFLSVFSLVFAKQTVNSQSGSLLYNEALSFSQAVKQSEILYKNSDKIKLIKILAKDYEQMETALVYLQNGNMKELMNLKKHPLIVSENYLFNENIFNLLKIKTFIASYQDIIQTVKSQINSVYIKNNEDRLFNAVQKLYYQKLLEYKRAEYVFYRQNFEKLKKIPIRQIFLKKEWTVEPVKENIAKIETVLRKKQKELKLLKLNYEKWKLLNNKINMANMKKYIDINTAYQKKYAKILLKNYIYLWGYYYHFNNYSEVKKYTGKIITGLKYLNYNNGIFDYSIDEKAVLSILNGYIKDKFKKENKTEVKNTQTGRGLKTLRETIEKAADYPLIKIGNKSISVFHFLFFLAIIIFSVILGRHWKSFIYKLRDKENISYSTATLLANLGYYFILIIFAMFGLNSVGVNLSSLTVIAGALSIGIGFGLQNIVSNFVSGIILMFEKSIKVGDYVQIDENTRGEVVDILMRSTIVRTNDNIDLIIPNQKFIENNVINWTKSDEIIGMKIPFGVAYGTDIEQMKKDLFEALEKSRLPFIRSSNKKYEPLIVFTEMGASSLNFYLYIYVKGKFVKKPNVTKSLFMEFIYKVLNEKGYSIPFPQMDIYIKEGGIINADKNIGK